MMRNAIRWASVRPPTSDFHPLDLTGVQLFLDPSLGEDVAYHTNNVSLYYIDQVFDQGPLLEHSTTVSGTFGAGDPAKLINGLTSFNQMGNSWPMNSDFETTIWPVGGGGTKELFLAMVWRANTIGFERGLFCLPYISNQDHQSFLVTLSPSNYMSVTCGNGTGYAGASSLQTGFVNSSPLTITTSPSTTNLIVVTASAGDAAIRVRFNGVEQVITYNHNSTSMPMSQFLVNTRSAALQWRLGVRQHSSGTYPASGDYGDVLLLDNIPDASTITQIEEYEMEKYNVV